MNAHLIGLFHWLKPFWRKPVEQPMNKGVLQAERNRNAGKRTFGMFGRDGLLFCKLCEKKTEVNWMRAGDRVRWIQTEPHICESCGAEFGRLGNQPRPPEIVRQDAMMALHKEDHGEYDRGKMLKGDWTQHRKPFMVSNEQLTARRIVDTIANDPYLEGLREMRDHYEGLIDQGILIRADELHKDVRVRRSRCSNGACGGPMREVRMTHHRPMWRPITQAEFDWLVSRGAQIVDHA